MSIIYERFVRDIESTMDRYVAWQIEHEPPLDFRRYAYATADLESVLACAEILYPRFIKVDGVIVREDAYSPDNWAHWRKAHDPYESARMVNHVHISDRFRWASIEDRTHEQTIGNLLALFWRLAVKDQFPDSEVHVEYGAGILHVWQDPPR